MSGWDRSAITIATFLPAAGAIVIALVPRQHDRMIRWIGVLVTGAAMVVAIAIAVGFNYGYVGTPGRVQHVVDLRDRRPIPRRGSTASRCPCSC